jgi:hypothetical protein
MAILLVRSILDVIVSKRLQLCWALLPIAVSLSACTLLLDTSELGIDASQTTIDASDSDSNSGSDSDASPADAGSPDARTIDATPLVDASDCGSDQRLTLHIVNADNPGGTVVVTAEGVVLGTCSDSNDPCHYCISTADIVVLDQTPLSGAVFDKWSTQCANLCVGGNMADPCQFTMPTVNVGCLADYTSP